MSGHQAAAAARQHMADALDALDSARAAHGTPYELVALGQAQVFASLAIASASLATLPAQETDR